MTPRQREQRLWRIIAMWCVTCIIWISIAGHDEIRLHEDPVVAVIAGVATLYTLVRAINAGWPR